MGVMLRSDRMKDSTRSRIEADFPDGFIFACDFHVPGIQKKGEEVIGGYKWGRIVNVDHHAPTRRMERLVSSANLAMSRVKALGRPDEAANIVINHTDCDSVLTAAILVGDLEPDARFGEAAIAADHTGAENSIADLLQALQHKRDYGLSLRNLKLLLAGLPLEQTSLDALAERRKKRWAAFESLDDFKMEGAVAYREFKEDVDGELIAPLIPDAVVILLAVPGKKGPNPCDIKIRLGKAAPSGFSLHTLRLRQYDPGYGGRWNAGSDRRAGGTGIPVHKYAKEVSRRVNEVLKSPKVPHFPSLNPF